MFCFVELSPGCWVVDQPAVLVALAVVPAADGHGHLDAVLFELGHLAVEVVVQVGPGVVRLHHQVGIVQHSEPIHCTGNKFKERGDSMHCLKYSLK